MRYFIPLCLAVAIISCTGKESKEEEGDEKTKQQASAVYVDTMHLKRQTFNKQIVCNGKLRAVQKSEVSFPRAGILAKINVASGESVKRGTLLAVIDTEDAEIALYKSKRAMEKARLDLMDKLIGQGYSGEDTVSVPKMILDNAKHSSGYNTAQDNLAEAERELEDCYISAPFSGRVANMDSKVFDRSGEVLCTLIDDSSFDVEFNLLEAELSEVAKGQSVSISPFVDEERVFEGRITEVNPMVDDKGQVKVRAKVANKGGYLIEGMNVKLVLGREISGQFVVPREAVVLRDGFNVMFRYVDGEAVWTYIDVEMSNIDSHLITGNKEKETTISEEDIIIISGNRNLADGVKVNVK